LLGRLSFVMPISGHFSRWGTAMKRSMFILGQPQKPVLRPPRVSRGLYGSETGNPAGTAFRQSKCLQPAFPAQGWTAGKWFRRKALAHLALVSAGTSCARRPEAHAALTTRAMLFDEISTHASAVSLNWISVLVRGGDP
jgi:hypothetical protein